MNIADRIRDIEAEHAENATIARMIATDKRPTPAREFWRPILAKWLTWWGCAFGTSLALSVAGFGWKTFKAWLFQ